MLLFLDTLDVPDGVISRVIGNVLEAPHEVSES